MTVRAERQKDRGWNVCIFRSSSFGNTSCVTRSWEHRRRVLRLSLERSMAGPSMFDP